MPQNTPTTFGWNPASGETPIDPLPVEPAAAEPVADPAPEAPTPEPGPDVVNDG